MSDLVRGSDDVSRERSTKALARSEARRASLKTEMAQLPTIPLSICPDTVVIGQRIFRFLFPVAGSIVRAVSDITGCRNIELDVSIQNAKGGINTFLLIGDGPRTTGCKIPVEAGDLLTVSIMDIAFRQGESVEGVNFSVSLLFQTALDSSLMVDILSPVVTE